MNNEWQMKNPGSRVSMLSLVIAFILFHLSCVDGRQAQVNADKKQSWTTILSNLRSRISELENTRNAAQSFIESAEVHQVMRTEEEKARQLSNLHLYMAEIELKVDPLQQLVKMYIDSIKKQSNEDSLYRPLRTVVLKSLKV